MELTTQQKEILTKIDDFLTDKASAFILKGYAGTGKTTMVKLIADHAKAHYKVMLMAPTGRAARVLSVKTGMEATTIHKGIYSFSHIERKKTQDLADSEYKLLFPINTLAERVVVIVDEASMVSSRKVDSELFQFGTGNVLDDLLTFIRPSFGGKVIFIGDPAQLPPVGDNASHALDERFLTDKGLTVETAELTEVLRQDGGSTILKDAIKVRDLLSSDKRNRLVFDEKEGEVEELAPDNVIDKYMSTDSVDKVLIAYSNRKVAAYNRSIRLRKYNAILPLQEGEPLMVVKNNYSLNLMNGDMTHVIHVGGIISQSAPVYVQKGGRKEKVKITLTFQQVTVAMGNDDVAVVYIILDLLENDRPSLTINENRALYINFCMRNPKLKQDSDEFTEKLKRDPFYNALQAKYGYAVTGHKCQGGEWSKVFVDYDGRTGLSDDCLRWNYTATTRARDTLYVINLPHITPFANFRIENIGSMKKISPDFRKYGEIQKNPLYEDSLPDFIRAKCQCICHNLTGTPFSIESVQHGQYREIYNIATPDGVERFDIVYKGCGVFMPAECKFATKYTAIIRALLDDEHNMPTVIDYKPSDDIHAKLFEFIHSACDELQIPLINVVERPDYSTDFYFSTSGTVSSLKVYIDKNGYVTYARPASFIGSNDEQLKSLAERLQKKM